MRASWQELLTKLVDAILADAIEASALEFPTDHPFWGPFGPSQGRDIVHRPRHRSASGSTGGAAGWTSGSPRNATCRWRSATSASTRCASASGRTRRPCDSLFGEVQVAADEYLAVNAGDLTLGEMVTMLGRRADALAELWNQWGTIRPLLLQDA